MALPGSGSYREVMRRTVPPQAYFIVSAVFHYLGPAFAVLLFARIDPLGVAWLRIAAAGLIFRSGAGRGAPGVCSPGARADS